MKRFFKYAALVVAVLMVCGSAWAYDSYLKIAQSPNNKGDAMIFPWFLALDGGWQSTMTVINTDQTNSVVAKVVFRSFKNSEELLDFLIYLSPGDVWKGKVYVDTTGDVTVYSDDDSIVIDSQGTFATPEKPFKFAMFPVKCDADATYFGYAEIIEAAIGPVKNALGFAAPGVKKSDIFKNYIAGITSPLKTPYNFYFDTDYANQDLEYNNGTGYYFDQNALAGYMEFGNAALGLNTTYQAVTMSNYLCNKYLAPNVETVFGEGSLNSLAEIEAALSVNNIGLPYLKNTKNITFHMFTFPTKESVPTTDCKLDEVASPFFKDNAFGDYYCITYGTTNYDLKENFNSTPVSGNEQTSSMCDEVYIVAPSEFESGWSNYLFYYEPGNLVDLYTEDYTWDELYDIYYEGAPVIPTFLTLGADGLTTGYGASTLANVWVYDNAWDDLVPGYQYFSLTGYTNWYYGWYTN